MPIVKLPARQPPSNEFGDKVRAHVRYVTDDGEYVPGVTTVVGLLNKPALVPWANRLGLQGIDTDSYVDEAAQTGSLAHYLIMCAITGKEADTTDFTPNQFDRALHALQAFQEWCRGKALDTVMTEKPMVSERTRFGGTIDWLVSVDGQLILVDWKTSAALYPEHFIQASAYVYLLRDNGHAVKGARIIKIPRKPGEGFMEHTLSGKEVQVNWQIFKHLLSVYQLRNELKSLPGRKAS